MPVEFIGLIVTQDGSESSPATPASHAILGRIGPSRFLGAGAGAGPANVGSQSLSVRNG